jgi:tetratricopeptide (TPR) repeat protein
LVIVKIVRTSVIAAALVVLPRYRRPAIPFYASLLTRGVSDAQRGDFFKAVKELRISAFGLVETPSEYLRAQVYLANALEHLGRHAEAATAVEKASLAERIDSSYATVAIDPETRSAFEALAVKALRPEQLAMVPSFRKTAAPPPAPPVVVVQKPVVVAPKPVAVVPKPVTPPPVAVEKPVVVAPKPAPPVQKPVAQAPAPVQQKQPPPVVIESPLVAASKHQPSQSSAALDASLQIADAQRMLNEGKILAARQIYLRLTQVDGLGRSTMLDVAKGLSLTSAWRESSVAYQKAMPFRSGEEIHQFYESVNRYELGDVAAARELLTRALPALPVTRETSLYKAKILGMP